MMQPTRTVYGKEGMLLKASQQTTRRFLRKALMVFTICNMAFLAIAQTDLGWQNLAQDGDLPAARAAFETGIAEGDSLAEIGWLLTFAGDGPTQALADAAVKVLARNPSGPAAEFVMKFMHAHRECLPQWQEATAALIRQVKPTNPELLSLYANHLRQMERTLEAAPQFYERSREAHFLVDWKVSERFGTNAIPAFERDWPASQPEYWQTPITDRAVSGVVMPSRKAMGSGVIYGYSAFENPAKQLVTLRIFTYHNLDLFVNGQRVAALANLEQMAPRVVFFEVELDKGRQEVMVKSTQTQGRNGQFSVQVTASAQPQIAQPGEMPQHALQINSEPVGKQVAVGLEKILDNRQEDLALFVKAQLAMFAKDRQTEHRLLDKLHKKYPSYQLVGGQLALVYLNMLPFIPQEEQLGKAFQILSGYLRAGNISVENQLSLGLLLAKARQTRQSLQLIQAAVDANPAYCEALKAQLLMARNEKLLDVREDAIRQMEALGPNHAWGQQELLTVARSDGDFKRIRQLLENLASMMPWEGYAAQLHEMEEDYQAAIVDLKRRADIFPDREYFPFAISRAYAELGDIDNQLIHLERTLELEPTARDALLDLVNIHSLKGDLETAKTRLRDYLKLRPADGEFRQRLSHLDGRTAFEAYRVDTRKVIEDAQKKPISEGADSELLLDQLMVRLFPDGSQMRYTHLVRRVLTKDGVDEESELRLPRNIEILELRTVKQDGTVLYPAEIDLKSSISLSGVSIGDFIDEEHIEFVPPAYYDEDGADAGMTFIYQNVDRIYHHSELVLIFPEDIQPEPVLLSRNMPVEPEVTLKDGLRYVRWLTKDMQPLREEQAMPPRAYFHPTTSFYYNTTWDEIRDYYVNAVRTRLALSDRMLAQVAAWKDLAESPRQLAQNIYEAVTGRIEPGQEFYKNVNLVWETSEGNGSLLLHAIYEHLDLDSDLVLVRPELFEDMIFDSPMPEFSYALLRLNIDGETHWLDANRPGLPFGYVPFDYRDSRGMVLDLADDMWLKVPSFADESERITTTYTLNFDDQGSVKGFGSERFGGTIAVSLDRQYATMTQPEIKNMVEVGINKTFPGAEIEEVTIVEALPRGSFEMTHQFTHPGLAEVKDGVLSQPFPLPQVPLLERYATLGSRELAVLVADPHINTAKVTMRLPEGYVWVTKPQQIKRETPFGTYTLSLELREDRELHLERTYHVPAQIIETEQYEAFQAFCRYMVDYENFTFKAEKQGSGGS